MRIGIVPTVVVITQRITDFVLNAKERKMRKTRRKRKNRYLNTKG